MTEPFACDMTALTAAERERHLATTRRLFAAVEAISDRPDGYTFRLDGHSDRLMDAAEFVSRERRCCPFFDFRIDVGAAGEGLRLHITGPEGVKPFIRAELGGAIDAAVRRAAGFEQSADD